MVGKRSKPDHEVTWIGREAEIADVGRDFEVKYQYAAAETAITVKAVNTPATIIRDMPAGVLPSPVARLARSRNAEAPAGSSKAVYCFVGASLV